MKCPHCGHEWKLPAQSAGGSKGGKASGAAKSRTSEQARAAVKARWEKARLNKANALVSDPEPAASTAKVANPKDSLHQPVVLGMGSKTILPEGH